jgi:hypothetical protein
MHLALPLLAEELVHLSSMSRTQMFSMRQVLEVPAVEAAGLLISQVAMELPGKETPVGLAQHLMKPLVEQETLSLLVPAVVEPDRSVKMDHVLKVEMAAQAAPQPY